MFARIEKQQRERETRSKLKGLALEFRARGKRGFPCEREFTSGEGIMRRERERERDVLGECEREGYGSSCARGWEVCFLEGREREIWCVCMCVAEKVRCVRSSFWRGSEGEVVY